MFQRRKEFTVRPVFIRYLRLHVGDGRCRNAKCAEASASIPDMEDISKPASHIWLVAMWIL